MQHIRNFSIIAHIDHGKSTLADRIIQLCGGLSDREMEAQVLDSMDLERERGITIKAQSAALRLQARRRHDLPAQPHRYAGHVDFSYEVSRSLAACEGALLVVDASQGVEAQSVANCYTAIEQGVEVVPVLNKIDLPSADAEAASAEIEDVIGIDAAGRGSGSAPRPAWDSRTCWSASSRASRRRRAIRPRPLQALIIDSWFDNYVGVVMLVRVMQGALEAQGQDPADGHRRDSSGRAGRRVHAEIARPRQLSAGEVGFIIAGIKELHDAHGRRHPDPGGEAGRRAAAWLQGSAAAGVRRLCSRSSPTSTRRCATRWKSCS